MVKWAYAYCMEDRANVSENSRAVLSHGKHGAFRRSWLLYAVFASMSSDFDQIQQEDGYGAKESERKNNLQFHYFRNIFDLIGKLIIIYFYFLYNRVQTAEHYYFVYYLQLRLTNLWTYIIIILT